jgi:pimeloyl-ACP methyl ester carboxylesterase
MTKSAKIALRTAMFCFFIIARVCAAAERAASIEYEFIERPANVQADFVPAQNTKLRFLTIKAIDGFRVEAVLGEPNSQPPDKSTLIVSAHGSGGRYDAGVNGFLARLLPAKGYAVLAINTRQSGARVNTDNFLEACRDIEAAVYTARALGYRSIVLHGNSLGTIQMQYYAANNWDPDIKVVVLTSIFANLPWKSRHILIQDEESFAQLHAAALKSPREGKENDVLPVGMRRKQGKAEPVTGRHFLTYRAEESSTADGTYWINRIPRPTLMVRDAGDAIIQAFEPYTLLSAAQAHGSLVPSIEYVLLPNPKGPNPGGHGFSDNQETLVNTIVGRLQDLKL